MSWLNDIVQRDPTARYVAYAGEVEFVKASEDDSLGRTLKLRLIGTPETQGKAHPFARFTRRRRGKAGSRFEASFAAVGPGTDLMLEVMLLSWISNPQGDTVVFLLDQQADKHPFMGATRATKDAPGTRWMLVAVEKDDTDELIEQGRAERLEQARTGKRTQHLSNVAQLIIKNPRFHEFLRENYDSLTEFNEIRADKLLKELLGIESKSELDGEGPEAVRPIAAFHRLRNAFVEWQERNGYTD